MLNCVFDDYIDKGDFMLRDLYVIRKKQIFKKDYYLMFLEIVFNFGMIKICFYFNQFYISIICWLLLFYIIVKKK